MVQPGRSLSWSVVKKFCIKKLQIERGTLATRRHINVLVWRPNNPESNVLLLEGQRDEHRENVEVIA